MLCSKFTVEVEKKSVTPTLNCKLVLSYTRGDEAPLDVFGVLLASDNRVLTTIHKVAADPNLEFPLVTKSEMLTDPQLQVIPKDYDANITLAAELSERHLDYIETLRDKDLKGDVTLGFRGQVRWLAPRLLAKVGAGPGRADTYVSSDRVYLVEKFTTLSTSCMIPSSEWVHEFAPALGVGSFAVFEIPHPEIVCKDPILQERLSAALASAARARARLRQGDWPQVCEDLRDVWELVRKTDSIGALLKRDGFTAGAVTAFEASMKNLFDLASKFAHRTDKDGNLVAEMKAEREDAYLVYSLAMSVLNLVARKASRYS